MNTYNELDKALLTIITEGQPIVFCEILSNLILHTPLTDVPRSVDRRLQSLKKKGLIRYKQKTLWSPGWVRCDHD